MRIKHTPTETYKVYSYLPCKGKSFKDIKRWYPYKHYASKTSALRAIKRIKEQGKGMYDKDLIWKIIWSPYPFAPDEKCIAVYNEDSTSECSKMN